MNNTDKRLQEIVEVLNLNRQAIGNGYDHGIGDWEFKKVAQEISALSKGEDKCLDCGEQRIWICACEGYDYTEIAKRVREQYVNETLKDAKDNCPVAREFRAIFGGCVNWLDQREDK